MSAKEPGAEAPIPISCKACIHVKTCAAYRAFAGALEQLKLNYEFLEDAPFSADILAIKCKEYTPPSKIFKMEPLVR